MIWMEKLVHRKWNIDYSGKTRSVTEGAGVCDRLDITVVHLLSLSPVFSQVELGFYTDLLAPLMIPASTPQVKVNNTNINNMGHLCLVIFDMYSHFYSPFFFSSF